MPPIAFNNIFAKKVIGSVVKDGKSIVISAATETTHWKRLDSAASSAGAAVKTAVMASSKALPNGTVEVCAREGTHKSAGDPTDHITAVCFDKNNKGTTVHLPVKKP